MRQTKFRVWSKEQKKMFYPGDDFIEGEKSFICLNLFGNPINAYSESGSDRIFNLRFSITEDEFELMQFTGLHDKNGKEIYEGDIIKYKYPFSNDFIGKIHFENGCFRLNDVYIDDVDTDLEIVGNIYQNPEWLKS
jgi:uncharacterized phage protein (TIGR01671 family)